jgi:hypothetical protein
LFRNEDVAGAQLYWGESFFAELPPSGLHDGDSGGGGGGGMPVNSFVGHEWVIRVKMKMDKGERGGEEEKVVYRWKVGKEAEKQEFVLSRDLISRFTE